MISDDTLREGMQGPGISFSTEEKKKLADKISSCGISRILVSYPSAHQSEWEIAKYLSSRNRFGEVYGLGRAINSDIDRIHSSGAHISLHFPFKYNSLDEVYDSIKYAVSLDWLTEVAVVDVTQYGINQLMKIVKRLSDLDVHTIQLPDTKGKANPKIISEIVAQAKRITDSKIEIHCHNDHGLSVANAIAGIEAGCDYVDTTFLGIGERNGITDTLTIAQYLLDTGLIDKESVDHMRSFSEEMLNIIIGKAGLSFFKNNLPNIGDNISTHTAGTHAAFSDVFGGTRFSVNVYTGRSMIKRILEANRLSIDDQDLTSLIENIKNISAEEGRTIPAAEIIEEAGRYVQSD
ncbi:hypothetical protein OXIME_000196 [Oxyplasma meridianum]|uniref:Pyruvate carboxyltransferase domain-containing protein n=1 Tax=Oxyplasma meridianum TaxID=3073602 RepID=A0AAX4NG00_9ARCH